jgi:hypothetical protein
VLNAILKKLNGHGQDVESLEAALRQLLEERATAERELSELRVRRHQGLLDDAADKILDGLERQIARVEIAIDKCDAATPGLRKRIVEAREAKRRAAEPALIAEFGGCFGEYSQALRDLARVIPKQIEIRQRAAVTIGAHRAAVLLPPFQFGGIATPESIKDWIERNSHLLVTAGGAAPPVSRLATPGTTAERLGASEPLPHERRPTTPAAHVAATLDTGRGEPTGRRRPLLKDNNPLDAGEVRCLIIRSGYPLLDGTTTCVGDTVRLPLTVAENALRSGAIEIVERSAPPAAISTTEEAPP